MNKKIPLTGLQKEIMREFYALPKTAVIFNKKERNVLWRKVVSRSKDLEMEQIDAVCPSLAHQIRKSYEEGKNIQSAVFSECVYAQTFANMFSLTLFVNCFENATFLPDSVDDLLKSYKLVPRYVYSNFNKSPMLVQAGSCYGTDSALITVIDLIIYTIEFKEPAAKTSEVDLPKYGEDGKLIITDDFLSRNPQFQAMLEEQQSLNFFDAMGTNIHNFSEESIELAVTNNYAKKYADVVCTEDRHGSLVMLPTNQVSLWAEIEGEIRPAGRNHYNVWTPQALRAFLHSVGAVIEGETVTVKRSVLLPRKERGGGGRVSGFKINPLFFFYAADCLLDGASVVFDINKVQQLNPTIAGKVFFKKLNYEFVKNYYTELL